MKSICYLVATIIAVLPCAGLTQEFLEAKSTYFAIQGVKKPGIYPVPSGGELTIAEAIEIGGGMLEGDPLEGKLSDPRGVRVYRVIESSQQIIKLDVRKNGKNRRFRIHAGDIIQIPVFML